MTLPTVPEERERHHSIATMTNIHERKQMPKKKVSQWTRRSTRWTLIADNVKVDSILFNLSLLNNLTVV